MKPRKANKAKAAKGSRKKFAAPTNMKTGKSGEAATKPIEVPTIRVTPGTTLKSLLTTCRGLKQNADGIISKLREEIGFAVEKKNLHKGAFADLRRFDKMEAEKAAEHWHILVRYLELAGVMDKIDAVGRLPLGDDAVKGGKSAEDEGEEPEIELGDGKPPKPAKAAKASKTSNGAADAEASEANTALLRDGIKPAEVSKPHFGQKPPAPGGTVHMLPDQAAKPH